MIAKMSKRSSSCQARSSCLAVERWQTRFTLAPGGDSFFQQTVKGVPVEKRHVVEVDNCNADGIPRRRDPLPYQVAVIGPHDAIEHHNRCCPVTRDADADPTSVRGGDSRVVGGADCPGAAAITCSPIRPCGGGVSRGRIPTLVPHSRGWWLNRICDCTSGHPPFRGGIAYEE